MSKIKYCDKLKSNSIFFHKYKVLLQAKIDIICKKIEFNDNEVTWYIFCPKNENATIDRILVGVLGKDYGYCIPEKKEIYISTLSIQQSELVTPIDSINNSLGINFKKKDFLADVIIDEITHIQTGQDHGNQKYDSNYKKNKDKYYSW